MTDFDKVKKALEEGRVLRTATIFEEMELEKKALTRVISNLRKSGFNVRTSFVATKNAFGQSVVTAEYRKG